MKINTNLKRIVIGTIGGLLFIGLLTAGIFQTIFQTTAQAQEEIKSDSNSFFSETAFHCSNKTLKGRYAVIGNGFAAPPPTAPLPFATISLMTLNGEGNLTNKVTRSNNGNISRSLDSGTYTVNADCTGTITIAVPTLPFQLTFDLVIADLQDAAHGKEFYFIATTTGGVVTSAAKRIQ